LKKQYDVNAHGPNTLATGCGGLQLDVPDLLLRIEGCLKDEADRVAHYLDASTRKPLIEIVEQNLLQAHNMQIVERGFEPLIVCPRHVVTAWTARPRAHASSVIAATYLG